MKSISSSLNVPTSTAYRPVVPRVAVQRSPWRAWLEVWASQAIHYLSGSTAPQIRERRDRSGATIFKVYDPLTEESRTFTSESEVRVWLEERYSR